MFKLLTAMEELWRMRVGSNHLSCHPSAVAHANDLAPLQNMLSLASLFKDDDLSHMYLRAHHATSDYVPTYTWLERNMSALSTTTAFRTGIDQRDRSFGLYRHIIRGRA